MTSTRKELLLCWLPVVVLPLSNIFMAVVAHQSLQIFLPYVVGSVTEELFFRWFLLKQWLFNVDYLKPAHAIFLVSILFAGIHLFNLRAGAEIILTIMQVFFAFAFSIWAGAVVWKSRSIMIPLIAHLFLNLTATVDILWIELVIIGIVLLDGTMLTLRCRKLL